LAGIPTFGKKKKKKKKKEGERKERKSEKNEKESILPSSEVSRSQPKLCGT
jgi:hypothetical protein